MKEYYTCCFFGHREIEITDELVKDLTETIEKMITEENYQVFLFGGFGQFDDLCYKIVSELRKTYPFIKRYFYLWDPKQERGKKPGWLLTEEYEDYYYHGSLYYYWYTSIYYRNTVMIKDSDCILFYLKNPTSKSGAYKAYLYAKRLKKQIRLIHSELPPEEPKSKRKTKKD